MGEYPSYIACHIFNEKHEMYLGDDGAPRVMQDGKDGDMVISYIGYIRKGVTVGFRSFDIKGATGLRIKTRGYINGDFLIKESWDSEPIGRITVQGDNIWTSYEGKAAFKDGVSDLYLTFDGSGTGYLKSFEFLH